MAVASGVSAALPLGDGGALVANPLQKTHPTERGQEEGWGGANSSQPVGRSRPTHHRHCHPL